MEYEAFKPVRRKTAQTIYEALKANPPEGCIRVDEPDGIGATGLDFGDAGYVLVQVEHAGEHERAAAA